MLKKSVLGSLLMLIVVFIAACGDNSIDTRVSVDSPASTSSLIFPVELTGDRIEAGEIIYSNNCASCHGAVNGRPVLDSAPPHGDAGHTWHHADRLLYQWILDKPPLATVMPAFRGTLTDDQVMQVLAYIKNSWLPEIQDRQNEGSGQYEAQIIEFGTE
jgi:cytochrome c5